MSNVSIFPLRIYVRKFINTFFPRILFRLSPNRYWAQHHWKSQNEGDIHGYNNYLVSHPREPILISELAKRVTKESPILDLGCNCGYYLSLLKKEGYQDLHGIDISPVAIRYGKENLDLDGVDLIVGSFEETLPEIIAKGIQFDLVYSLGATIELVHPGFDIVTNICRCSRKYVILIIAESAHSFPRFWEYEFNRNGFVLVKCIRPYNGESTGMNPIEMDSFLVFERVQ